MATTRQQNEIKRTIKRAIDQGLFKPVPDIGDISRWADSKKWDRAIARREAVIIQNGMTLLDLLLGEEWALLVDLGTFNIADGEKCVLGQVFRPAGTAKRPSYHEGIEAIHTYLSDLNGEVSGALRQYEWDEGFAGGFSNNRWIAAIEARQVELVGSVERATEVRKKYYAKLRRKGA